MSVVGAASILGFGGTEAQLVQSMIQNLHPRVKLQCMFQSRPQSVLDLYSLATTVVEAMAVGEQRERGTIHVPQVGALRQRSNRPLPAEVSLARPDSRGRYWACGQAGHLERNCLSRTRLSSNSGREGNASGARQ